MEIKFIKPLELVERDFIGIVIKSLERDFIIEGFKISQNNYKKLKLILGEPNQINCSEGKYSPLFVKNLNGENIKQKDIDLILCSF